VSPCGTEGIFFKKRRTRTLERECCFVNGTLVASGSRDPFRRGRTSAQISSWDQAVDINLRARAEVDLAVGDGRWDELHSVAGLVAVVGRH
jgi:hypothetical protein